MPKYPFEASFDEILKDPERYISAVFSCLESEFLIMPKGTGLAVAVNSRRYLKRTWPYKIKYAIISIN